MQKRLIFLILLCLPTLLFGQLDAKPLVEDVGIDEHLGDQLDLDLTFTNQQGKTIALRDLINGDRPTVIVPVYYSCPNICTAILGGVRDLLDESDLVLGKHWQVVNISFDPTNTAELAAEKANNYYATLKDPEPARENWQFLTGDEENIKKVMDQIGFKYKWVNDQYSHASIIVVVSPTGKITRYFYGVQFQPRDMRLAVIEASAGKVGNTLERMLVYCFRYDPIQGKYVPYAWRIMRIGGLLTLIMLAGLLVFLWSKKSIAT